MIERPSLKFDFTGSSMLSPFGLVMIPLMAPSWEICFEDPLAPESAIINNGLNPCWSSFISFIKRSVSSFFVLFHKEITLLFFSSSEIVPARSCFLMCASSSSAFLIRSFFPSGTIISERPIVAPKIVAYLYPRSFTLSRSSTATDGFSWSKVSVMSFLSCLSPRQ